MSKKRTIGFVQHDEADDPQPEERDYLKEAIERIWSPEGETENMDFYSPIMIQEFIGEWARGTFRQINDTMTKLGFRSTTLDGFHCWIVYEKNKVPDEFGM